MRQQYERHTNPSNLRKFQVMRGAGGAEAFNNTTSLFKKTREKQITNLPTLAVHRRALEIISTL
jgi:hypothetical protein